MAEILKRLPNGRWFITEEEEQRRRKAYQESKSDKDAGKKLGISETGFAYWRVTRKLPPKGRPRFPPSYDVTQPTFALSKRILLIRALRLRGLSWSKIARRLNLSNRACQIILRNAYKPVYEGAGCIRWEDAVKGLTPRAKHLLDKYGGCLSK